MSSIAAAGPDALRGLDEFKIEVLSWAYSNSGTRFKVFPTPGVPRDPYEKIADAAQVHALTGAAGSRRRHRQGATGAVLSPALSR